MSSLPFRPSLSVRSPRVAALAVLAAALAFLAAPPARAVTGTLGSVFPPAPCCDFHWTPPNEAGTAPSDVAGAPYHSYSFFVTESGVYRVTSGPGDAEDALWQGLVALYAPPFDPARPLDSLLGVDYYDTSAQPAAELSAFLVAGVVYRVVTSNVDEVDFHDDDRSGFAVQRERFCVEAEWATSHGTSGVARTVPHRSDDSVLFWFFAPDNWELQVKVLDACAVDGHFWVFFAATTDVEFELRVFGRGSNFTNPVLRRTYRNPLGHPADAVTDTAAFPCHEVRDN